MAIKSLLGCKLCYSSILVSANVSVIRKQVYMDIFKEDILSVFSFNVFSIEKWM